MKPIAIFYHAYFSGGEITTSLDTALRLCCEQLDTLNMVGLVDKAEFITIGVNGSEADVGALQSIIPWPKVQVVHNLTGTAELPTMKLMQDWCKTHPGYAVLYFHTKGAIHNGNPTVELWRRCMESAVLWGWRECVADLSDRGKDSAGAHWLTPARYPIIGKTPYWAGNFWWATSDFMNTLPTIDVSLSRYEAEVWIGRGPRPPRIRDYKPHFPMQGCHL